MKEWREMRSYKIGDNEGVFEKKWKWGDMNLERLTTSSPTGSNAQLVPPGESKCKFNSSACNMSIFMVNYRLIKLGQTTL